MMSQVCAGQVFVSPKQIKLSACMHACLSERTNEQLSEQNNGVICYSKVCFSLVQASGVEDHWSVREEAARLAALVCAKYGQPYYQIQPRITQALNTAFQQTNNPLTTHYGMPLNSPKTPSPLTLLPYQLKFNVHNYKTRPFSREVLNPSSHPLHISAA